MGASPGRVVCRTQPPGGGPARLDQVRHPLTRAAGGGRLEHAKQAQQQINDHNGDDHAHNAVRPTHSVWPPSASMKCTAPAARIDPTSRNTSGVRQGTRYDATGVSVADFYGFDIAPPRTAELYGRSQTAAKLTRTYALEPNSRANIVLHVVRTVWPIAPDTARAPALVAAVDLARADVTWTPCR
jgi:hypothetical protein